MFKAADNRRSIAGTCRMLCSRAYCMTGASVSLPESAPRSDTLLMLRRIVHMPFAREFRGSPPGHFVCKKRISNIERNHDHERIQI